MSATAPRFTNPETGTGSSGCGSTTCSPASSDAAWGDVDRDDPYWNERAFNGASMGFRELADTEDVYASVVDFFRRGVAKLTGAAGPDQESGMTRTDE